MEEYEKWGRGCIGRSEAEVSAAIIEAGGEVHVVPQEQKPIFSTTTGVSPGKLKIRASLTVVDGLVTEITFA